MHLNVKNKGISNIVSENKQNKRKTNTKNTGKKQTQTIVTVRKRGDIRCYIGSSAVWVPRQAFLLLFPTTASQAFARYCIFAIHYTIISITNITILISVFIIIVTYRDKNKGIKFSGELCESVYYGS